MKKMLLAMGLVVWGCSSASTVEPSGAVSDAGDAAETPFVVKYCRETSLDTFCRPPPAYGVFPLRSFISCDISNPQAGPLPYEIYPLYKIPNPIPAKYCFAQTKDDTSFCCTP